MKIGIIGAGAAGCFCAIELKRRMPQAEVRVFEAGTKALAKVAITGGGRCNLTNSFRRVKSLGQVYPRGERLMKKLLGEWDQRRTMQWWEQEGVRLVTQEDECVFPASQDAMEIVHTLLRLMRELGIELHTNHRVTSIRHKGEGYELQFMSGEAMAKRVDRVVLTIGGCPTLRSLRLVEELQLPVENPVPSLFTLNIADEALHALMGCVVEDVAVGLAGTKFRSEGPLLITHWGMSGPAILKLSSHAARHLAETDYRASLCVNWMGGMKEEEVRGELQRIQRENAQRLVVNEYPARFTARLWEYLCLRAGTDGSTKWCDVTGKRMNRLIATLTADSHEVTGKSRFKDEFVTCGGIALTALRGTSMEMKDHPGVYAAGEVLDVDAVTGGFNLQAAWTMGWKVAKSIAECI